MVSKLTIPGGKPTRIGDIIIMIVQPKMRYSNQKNEPTHPKVGMSSMVTLVIPSVDLFRKCGISAKTWWLGPPNSCLPGGFTALQNAGALLLQGVPDALHRRYARAQVRHRGVREATGVMLYLWRGHDRSACFPEKMLFLTHSTTGKSSNLEATSVDDWWYPSWYPRPFMWVYIYIYLVLPLLLTF